MRVGQVGASLRKAKIYARLFEGVKSISRYSKTTRSKVASEGGPVDREPPQPSPGRPSEDGDGSLRGVAADWMDDEGAPRGALPVSPA
jgi:hypothetical protein